MDFELAYIAERDTDFALMREASLSKDVQNLFLRKVGESGTLVKIIHSLTQEEEPGKVGESDVVLIFERPDKSRFAIFVEDKIAASAQPRQRKRYELRAPKLETELGLKGHYVVLFAPKKYLDKETSQDYKLQISHESVVDLCVDELDKKVLNDSCKVKQHGKTQIDQTNNNISVGQSEAIRMANTQPITFIWGPPGTGKTTTLARIALEHITQNHRVLMLSHTRIAVDNAVWKLYQLNSSLPVGKIIRYGDATQEEIVNHPYLTSYQLAIRKLPDLQNEILKLAKEKKSLSRTSERFVKVSKRI